ncbi:hypothetical protein GNZ10_13615 [Ralstonia sp. 3N]|uniref:hypothetical protein n=1 Tax=Ralstonia sp. 3N TaxID=2675750 RepID=UPI0015C52F0F|nr:hypothetical protein [Ralstonia sp. 3N]NPT50736.1 hypothetical protein [Ralstonia sp. 3N]
MARGASPGERRGGRKKGTPNKTTQDAREAIQLVAEGLGGADGMLAWAQSDKTNERIFWSTIYPRILPKEVKAEHTGEVGLTVEIVRFGTGSSD